MGPPRSPAWPRRGEPDPLPVGDPGRDVDLDLLAAHLHPAPAAGVARRLGHAAVAAAGVADRGADELAEAGAGDALGLAGAVAGRAGDDRRARLGAVAAAGLAQHRRVVGDLDADPVRGLGEVDRGGDRDVAALHRARAALAAVAERGVEAAGPEERAEEVADRPEVLEVRRVAAGLQPVVAVGVVGAPLVGVGEHLVGLGGLLELALGLRVVGVDVRVQLAGEPPEGLLDLGLVGAAIDAEDLVVVAGHRISLPRRRPR